MVDTANALEHLRNQIARFNIRQCPELNPGLFTLYALICVKSQANWQLFRLYKRADQPLTISVTSRSVDTAQEMAMLMISAMKEHGSQLPPSNEIEVKLNASELVVLTDPGKLTGKLHYDPEIPADTLKKVTG